MCQILKLLFLYRVPNGAGVSMTQSSGAPYTGQYIHGQPRLPSQPQPQTPKFIHHSSLQQQNQIPQPGYSSNGYTNNGFTPATLSVPTQPSTGFTPQPTMTVTMPQQAMPMQPIRPIQPVQVMTSYWSKIITYI